MIFLNSIFFLLSQEETSTCAICYEKRGFGYWKLGDFGPAIENLKKAIELASWDVVPRINLCEVLVDAKKYDQAKEGAVLGY